jgi:hypothetical protein
MPLISPAMAEAFRLLRTELYAHLDGAEFLAMKYEAWDHEDTESARKVIADLVAVLRSLLAEHEETTSARCRFCQHLWPCPSVQLLDQALRDPDREFVQLVR